MKKLLKVILIIILIIIIGMILIKTLSNEDDWICENGEWVKHGNPSAPKPTEPCGEQIFCAQDVMQCPDGSYVSRNSDLNCEFNLCPE